MNTETFASCLAARTYTYTVMHVLLGDEPTGQRLLAIDSELLADSFEMIGAQRPEALLEALASNTDENTLHREYMRCFVGPQKLPAPLWEAATRTGEDALFQEITLNVRKAYRASGFLPAQYPHVPDDHIALEMDFLRALSERVQTEESKDAQHDDLCAMRQFLDTHVNKWVDTFAKRIRASQLSDFYAAVSEAAAAFSKADAAWLAEVLD